MISNFPKNKKQLSVTMIYIFFVLWYFSQGSILQFIFISLMAFILGIIILYKRQLFSKWYSLILIVMILFSFISFPALLGNDAANKLIKGSLNNFEVQIHMKNQSINIPNSTFILVSQSNGNYYLVEKRNPVPEVVKLYVIPQSEISMITTVFHLGRNDTVAEAFTNLFKLN